MLIALFSALLAVVCVIGFFYVLLCKGYKGLKRFANETLTHKQFFGWLGSLFALFVATWFFAVAALAQLVSSAF